MQIDFEILDKKAKAKIVRSKHKSDNIFTFECNGEYMKYEDKKIIFVQSNPSFIEIRDFLYLYELDQFKRYKIAVKLENIPTKKEDKDCYIYLLHKEKKFYAKRLDDLLVFDTNNTNSSKFSEEEMHEIVDYLHLRLKKYNKIKVYGDKNGIIHTYGYLNKIKFAKAYSNFDVKIKDGKLYDVINDNGPEISIQYETKSWNDYKNVNCNENYFGKYYNCDNKDCDYRFYDKKYFELLIDNILKDDHKNEIKILLLGCGNLSEVSIILDCLQQTKNKKIHILCLDKVYWPKNFRYEIIKKVKLMNNNISIFLYECDFFDELTNNTNDYLAFDWIYFSRCINSVENNTYYNLSNNEYLNKIERMIKNISHFNIALSQVVHKGTDAEEFEKVLYKNLKNKYSFKKIADNSDCVKGLWQLLYVNKKLI